MIGEIKDHFAVWRSNDLNSREKRFVVLKTQFCSTQLSYTQQRQDRNPIRLSF